MIRRAIPFYHTQSIFYIFERALSNDIHGIQSNKLFQAFEDTCLYGTVSCYTFESMLIIIHQRNPLSSFCIRRFKKFTCLDKFQYLYLYRILIKKNQLAFPRPMLQLINIYFRYIIKFKCGLVINKICKKKSVILNTAAETLD